MTHPAGDDSALIRENKRYRDARKLLLSLEKAGFQARLAGGCVRDRLCQRIPNDYDIATTALPEQTMKHLRQAGYKVIPTGLDHGTVTVALRGNPVEITTLRRDTKTDGRHAQVCFDADFEQDAARRDFTVNAMFEDAQGEIHDYFGGRKDLAAGRLCFVGEPAARIQEDYLRILRLFRFWARFDLTPDPEALAATAEHAAGLQQISRERISAELGGILKASAAQKVLMKMAQLGILGLTLAIEGEPSTPPARCQDPGPGQLRPYGWLQQLLPWVQEPQPQKAAQKWAKTMRWSQAEANHLVAAAGLCGWPPLEAEPADFLGCIDDYWRLLGPKSSELWPQLLQIWRVLFPDYGDVFHRLERCQAHLSDRRQKPPLSGHQVAAITGLSGKELGDWMRELQRAWRNSAFDDATEAEAWLRQALSK